MRLVSIAPPFRLQEDKLKTACGYGKGMGVVKRPSKPGKGIRQYWYFRYRAGGRDVWESSGYTVREKTRYEAEALFYDRMRELSGDPEAAPEAKAEPTLEEVCTQFIDKKRMEHYAGWRSERSVLRAAIAFFGGNVPLSSITFNHVDRYKQYRSKMITDESLNRELKVLRTLFNRAIKWKLYRLTNPVVQAGMIRLKIKKERRAFTQEEVDRILLAAPAHFKDVITAALQTGMRRGEIVAAHLSHVNLVQEYIFVPASKSVNPRYVPLTKTMKDMLTRLLRDAYEGFLFLNQFGKPFEIFRVTKTFSAICRRAGIPDATFHCLRHTAATNMLDAGANPTDVQYLLGHKNIQTTMIYSHPGKTVRNAILLLDK